jgi:hypothetical protein
MLSPVYLKNPSRLAIVPDSTYGAFGSALSEYAQLIWLRRNLDRIIDGHTHIRVFHYRRFVAQQLRNVGKRSTNQPWATTIRDEQIPEFEREFSRVSPDSELLNTKVRFQGGMIGQYAHAHVLEDLLSFSRFLCSSKMYSNITVADMLQSTCFIPACNIAILSVENFKVVYDKIVAAASFLTSSDFVLRSGYQRRNLGFLLERLHSYVLQALLDNGKIQASFGFNYILSESERVSITI